MDIVNSLKNYGYAICEKVIPESECDRLTQILDELEIEYKDKLHSDFMTKAQIQIPNVHLLKPESFLDKINLPIVMDVAKTIFKEPFMLSNFNASRSAPNGGNRIHIDSRLPTTEFENTTHVIAMLCLDNFTKKNGATIVWPFSHNSGKDPRNIRNEISRVDSRYAEAKKGSIIFTLGQTWHDVGPNIDGSRRWGVIAYYTRWWIKPTYNFTRCGSDIFNKLNDEQKELFGFTSMPPSDAFKRYHTITPVKELPQDYDKIHH